MLLLGLVCLVSLGYQLVFAHDKCVSGQITSGGNSDGECCVFPFMYGNKLYTSCISKFHSKPWCATTRNYHTDKKWGNCVKLSAKYKRHCKDKYTFCKEWGKLGFCRQASTWHRAARVNCPVTCGVCKRKLKRTGTVYYVGKSKRTWEAAEQTCVDWGGHLASFTTRKEETDVYARIETGTPYWIGLYSTPDKQAYKWTDGTQFTDVFWDISEPNGGRDETCVGIKKWMLGFYMHDADCARKRNYICERKY